MHLSRWLAGFLVIFASVLAHGEVSKVKWGTTDDGKPVELYTLTDADMTVRISTFGARIVSIETPDRYGKKSDVVLGYDNFAQYEADKTYFGSVVGRYGNRIAKGTFRIDGKTFHIPLNDGINALHGGPEGFNRKLWGAHRVTNGVEMIIVSNDGDMGFPGTLTARVRYTIEGRSLHLDYSATTTKPTVINLTNHSYFNLAGNGRGTILDESLTIDADRYTPIDAGMIPTGEFALVSGTPFDFRKSTIIGARINESDEQLKLARGYDHNFVLNDHIGLHFAARVEDPVSGRTLTVTTTEPGVQFYSGNFFDGSVTGKFGVAYPKYAALCLETQHYPDSPNEPLFPTTLLQPGQIMHSTTIFTFGVNPEQASARCSRPEASHSRDVSAKWLCKSDAVELRILSVIIPQTASSFMMLFAQMLRSFK